MEDRRAHERLDKVEEDIKLHMEEHRKLEASLMENTNLTRSIEVNTKEFIELFKGATQVRTFFLWASPIVAFFGGLWALID